KRRVLAERAKKQVEATEGERRGRHAETEHDAHHRKRLARRRRERNDAAEGGQNQQRRDRRDDGGRRMRCDQRVAGKSAAQKGKTAPQPPLPQDEKACEGEIDADRAEEAEKVLGGEGAGKAVVAVERIV